ncbi:Htur_1727 family rSAM-partnered candidate RiPP [Natronococcus sp. A-GB7]|uniref:Htur_1727 family rSAM-partnered candidate RiPP n=1 Tax=Natronococcus sp. A-GB7 TaxID=3037649 RepID=UPI00241E4AAF|nr:Htur_1727 family rSAM-partnered candidate RiPP [Natronococcus sp. A-GB7]MDG5820453.1 Htur_1727 family rSAM-partnered candidate RiPP [Natronococcus sp. A-GB7]
MVEKTGRSRIDGEFARASPRWEVFVRDEMSDQLTYAGSVIAGDGEAAHEHASRLFGWYAVEVWVCPADEIERYSSRESEGDDRDPEDEAEPRVYEETEGTPRARER